MVVTACIRPKVAHDRQNSATERGGRHGIHHSLRSDWHLIVAGKSHSWAGSTTRNSQATQTSLSRREKEEINSKQHGERSEGRGWIMERWREVNMIEVHYIKFSKYAVRYLFKESVKFWLVRPCLPQLQGI